MGSAFQKEYSCMIEPRTLSNPIELICSTPSNSWNRVISPFCSFQACELRHGALLSQEAGKQACRRAGHTQHNPRDALTGDFR